MKKLSVSVIALLLILTFVSAETEEADVTADGVDDIIQILDQSVNVIDGATGKKWVLWKGKSKENYEEIVDDYSLIHITDEICFIKVITSWQSPNNWGPLGSSLYWFNAQNNSWFEATEDYFKEESELTIKAGEFKQIPFALSENQALIIHSINYLGAGGTIILYDYGIKVKVYDSNGEEIYQATLSDEGDKEITNIVADGQETDGEKYFVFLMFDNSETESVYRKVSYSATVYEAK